MTKYNVEKIENGVATLRYPDNSWAEIVLSSDMTEADLDDLALQYAPKTGTKPSFLSAGETRTATAKTIETPTDDRADYIKAREEAYGTYAEQLEYITEQGLYAWQVNVSKIKSDNPKPE